MDCYTRDGRKMTKRICNVRDSHLERVKAQIRAKYGSVEIAQIMDGTGWALYWTPNA